MTPSCPGAARFAGLLTGLLGLTCFTSCQGTDDRLLSVSESVAPQLSGTGKFVRFQCYFFTAPDDFLLLENTEGAHLAGVFSPEVGENLVQQIRNKRGFELQSAPSLTNSPGQRGKIEVVREFIFPTEYKAPQVPAKMPEGGLFPVTPAHPSAFDTRLIGITAEFKGRKDPRGNIDFEFEVERTAFLGFVNYGSPIMATAKNAFGKPVEVVITENRIEMPVFDTKSLASTLTLPSGHYVAIGGLRADRQENLTEVIDPSTGTRPEWTAESDANLFALIKVELVDE